MGRDDLFDAAIRYEHKCTGVMLKLKQMCFDEATHIARIERALSELSGE